MISFFRTIRRKLIARKRIARYAVYAVGELLLVVTGILIALQVNTWNENRKLSHERVKLLHVLKADFQIHYQDIEHVIRNGEHIKAVQERLLGYSSGKIPIDIPDDSLRSLMQEWYRFSPLRSVTSSLDQAIATGTITLIENQALISGLNSHRNRVNGYERVFNRAGSFIWSENFALIAPVLGMSQGLMVLPGIDTAPEQHPSFELSGEALGAFLQQPEIYALIHQAYVSTVLLNNWAQGLRSETETILAEIENSLNN